MLVLKMFDIQKKIRHRFSMTNSINMHLTLKIQQELSTLNKY